MTPDLFHQPDLVIYRPSNNPESLETNIRDEKDFNRQCEITYLALQVENLTNRNGMAMNKYAIGDLRRRCKDLTDIYHIPVYSRFIEGSRYKEYSLKPFES